MCSIRPGPARNLLTSLSRRGITLRTSQPSFISPRTAPSIPLTWGSHQGLRYSSSHATPQSTPYGSPFSSLDQYQSRREQGERYLLDQGYDLGSAIEQPVVWGDCDMMGHLNNVQTLRYCETSRMQFVRALLPELPASYETSLCQGKELVPGSPGVILGSVSARYKRPVYYPDTLLVAHRTSAIKPDRFILEAVCWSMSQQAVVTVGEADMVCYSYANLKKMNIPEPLRLALEKRLASKAA